MKVSFGSTDQRRSELFGAAWAAICTALLCA
jgi:hypothetical protein